MECRDGRRGKGHVDHLFPLLPLFAFEIDLFRFYSPSRPYVWMVEKGVGIPTRDYGWGTFLRNGFERREAVRGFPWSISLCSTERGPANPIAKDVGLHPDWRGSDRGGKTSSDRQCASQTIPPHRKEEDNKLNNLKKDLKKDDLKEYCCCRKEEANQTRRDKRKSRLQLQTFEGTSICR